MEAPTESPTAVKVEKNSHSVILTYFHGDISSMVDAHFSRALNKVCKVKAPTNKQKTVHKKIKTEDSPNFQDSRAEAYSEAQGRPATECFVTFNPAEDPCSSWHAFQGRTVEGSELPPIAYSLSPNGLNMMGQQYSSSLLNLLHSEGPPVRPSSSKDELPPNWTVPQVDPAAVFEPGRRLEKKDLYWY